MIKLINLKKCYDNNTIIDIDYFKFEANKKYLLIGENGSGKSTLLKLIIGAIFPTTGSVNVDFKRIGFVPEKVVLPEFINLDIFLKLINCNYDNKYIILFSLNKYKKFYKYSKGMKQKAVIIQALINDFDIIIFDEPMNGLDKISKIKFLNLLEELKKTIIVATHYPDEFKHLSFNKIRLIDGMLYDQTD